MESFRERAPMPEPPPVIRMVLPEMFIREVLAS
jgi:hypothetical protein